MSRFADVKSVFNTLALAAAVALVAGCTTAKTIPEQAQAEPATRIVQKEVVLDATTLFAFDSAELTGEGRAALDELVRKAGGAAAGRITVTGHTDRIGPERYNMGLSERRAQAVAAYMAQQGVPEASLTAEGRGESEPVVQCEDQSWNALVECLQPNRRVVVEYPVTVEEEMTVDE